MTYQQVTIIDGDPVPAVIINNISAAVAQHDAYFGAKYSAETVTVGTTASVTFTGLPTTMRRLTLWANLRGDTAATLTSVEAQIGGDTGANYRSVVAFDQTGGSYSQVTSSGAATQRIGYMTAASVAAGIWGVIRHDWVGWNSPHANGLKGTGTYGLYDSASSYVIGTSMTDYAGSATYTSLLVKPAAGNFISGSQFFISGE